MPLLFVTGMQRSGTTLLDHLLDAHPDLSVLSQSFPLLFVDVRARFLRAAEGREHEFPLSPMYREATTSEQFTRFLGDYALQREQLDDVFSRMSGYSGQYTRPSEDTLRRAIASLPAGDFCAQLAHLYLAFSERSAARWHGGKETLCEAFAPYLLQRGAKVLLVLRDPRDVLASLNHGDGGTWAGSPKPTLFNLRHWRKSVALALSFRDHPNFATIRYEDLVRDMVPVLSRISQCLGIRPFDDRDVLAQWRGNSSFGELRGLDTAPLGRYRDVLAPEVIRFVEATCYPEMRALGYECAISANGIADAIRSFVEPYPIQRASLQGYGSSALDVEAELTRIDLLSCPSDDDDRLDHFIFPGTRRALTRSGAAA